MRNRLFGDSGLKNQNFLAPKDLSFAEKKSNSSRGEDSFGSDELNDSFRDRMIKIDTVEKNINRESRASDRTSSNSVKSMMTFGKNSVKIMEENKLRESMSFKGSSLKNSIKILKGKKPLYLTILDSFKQKNEVEVGDPLIPKLNIFDNLKPMALSDFADTLKISETELLSTLNFDISKLPTPKIPENKILNS